MIRNRRNRPRPDMNLISSRLTRWTTALISVSRTLFSRSRSSDQTHAEYVLWRGCNRCKPGPLISTRTRPVCRLLALQRGDLPGSLPAAASGTRSALGSPFPLLGPRGTPAVPLAARPAQCSRDHLVAKKHRNRAVRAQKPVYQPLGINCCRLWSGPLGGHLAPGRK